MNQDVLTYKKINLILAGIIVMVFIYSGIFDHKKANHPIKSNYTRITGETSISTGLSRSFSAILRLDLQEARTFNPYGISVFLFFLLQLGLRLFFSWAVKQFYFEFKLVVLMDIVLSSALFIFHFEPFIKDLVHRS